MRSVRKALASLAAVITIIIADVVVVPLRVVVPRLVVTRGMGPVPVLRELGKRGLQN